MIPGLLFLLVLTLSGWFYASAIVDPRSRLLRASLAVPLGNILYCVAFQIGHIVAPWSVAVVLLAASICIWLCFRSGKSAGLIATLRADHVSWDKADTCILVGVLLFFCIPAYTGLGPDSLVHFSFASQLIGGKYPPSFHGFPDIPAKYHYGWACLLGSLSRVSGASLPAATDVLTIYSLSGAIVLLTLLTHALGFPRKWRSLVVFAFFLGSGLIEILHLALYGNTRAGLTLLSLYFQFPWTFGVSIFLIVLNVVARIYNSPLKAYVTCTIWFWFPLAGVGLVCASAVPFVLLSMGVFIVWTLAKTQTRKHRYIAMAFALASAASLCAAWASLGGMFASGSLYDGLLVLKPSIIALGIHRYAFYQSVYLAMSPITAIIFAATAARLWYSPMTVFDTLPRTLVSLSCLFLYPLPLILFVDSVGIWDNYCKFPMYGILAGWLLVPTVAGDVLRWTMRFSLQNRLRRLAVMLILLLCFNNAILLLATPLIAAAKAGHVTLVSDDLRVYRERVRSSRRLIRALRQHVGYDAVVVLLRDDLTGMYPLSRQTGKPKVSLYGYLEKNFGKFVFAAEETGVSVANCYEYNFPINRTLECELYETVDGLLRGDVAVLTRGRVNFILVDPVHSPSFVEKWEAEGHIELVADDAEESWCLYRIVGILPLPPSTQHPDGAKRGQCP